MNVLGNILVREATEGDINEILELFQGAYGHDYAFPQYFDPLFLKRLVFSDDCLILVAQDQRTRQLLGTGSVVFDVGAFADLVGDFGRLVVHPDGRGRGIGKLLMEDRLIRVGNHLHVALVDNRVAHTYSHKISICHGFAPVGYLPIHNGEPVALFARYFNGALNLRRNHPRVAPSVHWLAEIALRHTGLPCDVIVDESASAYPAEDEFELEEMSAKGTRRCCDSSGDAFTTAESSVR